MNYTFQIFFFFSPTETGTTGKSKTTHSSVWHIRMAMTVGKNPDKFQYVLKFVILNHLRESVLNYRQMVGRLLV